MNLQRERERERIAVSKRTIKGGGGWGSGGRKEIIKQRKKKRSEAFTLAFSPVETAGEI